MSQATRPSVPLMTSGDRVATKPRRASSKSRRSLNGNASRTCWLACRVAAVGSPCCAFIGASSSTSSPVDCAVLATANTAQIGLDRLLGLALALEGRRVAAGRGGVGVVPRGRVALADDTPLDSTPLDDAALDGDHRPRRGLGRAGHRVALGGVAVGAAGAGGLIGVGVALRPGDPRRDSPNT